MTANFDHLSAKENRNQIFCIISIEFRNLNIKKAATITVYCVLYLYKVHKTFSEYNLLCSKILPHFDYISFYSLLNNI